MATNELQAILARRRAKDGSGELKVISPKSPPKPAFQVPTRPKVKPETSDRISQDFHRAERPNVATKKDSNEHKFLSSEAHTIKKLNLPDQNASIPQPIRENEPKKESGLSKIQMLQQKLGAFDPTGGGIKRRVTKEAAIKPVSAPPIPMPINSPKKGQVHDNAIIENNPHIALSHNNLSRASGPKRSNRRGKSKNPSLKAASNKIVNSNPKHIPIDAKENLKSNDIQDFPDHTLAHCESLKEQNLNCCTEPVAVKTESCIAPTAPQVNFDPLPSRQETKFDLNASADDKEPATTSPVQEAEHEMLFGSPVEAVDTPPNESYENWDFSDSEVSEEDEALQSAGLFGTGLPRK